MCEECKKTKELLVEQLVCLQVQNSWGYRHRTKKQNKEDRERLVKNANNMDVSSLIDEIRHEAWQSGVNSEREVF